MQNKLYFLILIFFASITLLTASLVSKERAEKAYADDYDTYVQPGEAGLSAAVIQQISEFPSLLLLGFVFTPIPNLKTNSRALVENLFTVPKIPLFLFHCRFLI